MNNNTTNDGETDAHPNGLDMEVSDTFFPDVRLIAPRIYEDHRGFFMETYSSNEYKENGIGVTFVQDNFSNVSCVFGTLFVQNSIQNCQHR